MSTRARKARDEVALGALAGTGSGRSSTASHEKASRRILFCFILLLRLRKSRRAVGSWQQCMVSLCPLVPSRPQWLQHRVRLAHTAELHYNFQRRPGSPCKLLDPSLTVINEQNPQASKAKSPLVPREPTALQGIKCVCPHRLRQKTPIKSSVC